MPFTIYYSFLGALRFREGHLSLPLSLSLSLSLSLYIYIYIYIYIYNSFNIMITFIIMCLLDFFHIAFYFINNYIIIFMKYKHVPSNSGGKSGTCPPLMKWIIFRNFFFEFLGGIRWGNIWNFRRKGIWDVFLSMFPLFFFLGKKTELYY
jgi:hypothetical protein